MSGCFQNWCFQALRRCLRCWHLRAYSPPERALACGESTAVVNERSLQSRGDEHAFRAGMPGKNVEWVPCSTAVLDKMFELANVAPGDYLIDPGSGDGRIVIGAAKLGARAFGLEANSDLVELSRRIAETEGVSDRVSFSVGDFFDCDFSDATVVTLFLRWDINLALRGKILALKPGTRVVSNIFDMGDWIADQIVKVEDENYYFRNHTVYLWIVPATVEGIWKLSDGVLTLRQRYQILEGNLVCPGKTLPASGRVSGKQVSIIIDGREFQAEVSGNRMDMTSGGSRGIRWSALLDGMSTPE